MSISSEAIERVAYNLLCRAAVRLPQDVREALAQARAGDRGWDLAVLQAAARQAFASGHGGHEPERLELIQVVDRPGTDADEAVFRAVHGHHAPDIVLGREGDRWVAR